MRICFFLFSYLKELRTTKVEFAFKSVVSFFVLGICHRQQLNALNHLPPSSSHIQEYNLGSADFALREYLLPVDRRCNQRVFRTNGRPQPWSPEKKKRKLNNFHIMHTAKEKKILCDRVEYRWTFWVKLRAAWICRHRLKWCRPFGSRRVTIWKDDSGARRLHFLKKKKNETLYLLIQLKDKSINQQILQTFMRRLVLLQCTYTSRMSVGWSTNQWRVALKWFLNLLPYNVHFVGARFSDNH